MQTNNSQIQAIVQARFWLYNNSKVGVYPIKGEKYASESTL